MRLVSLIRRLFTSFVLACLFVAASVVAFGLHLDLPRGRRVVSNLVGHTLAAELRGRFVIGAIERLRPGGAVLRDFRVWDERGRQVLVVSKVTLRAELLAVVRELLVAPERARLVVEQVELEQADARLFDDAASGVPSLALAFTPRPRPAKSTSAPSALSIDVRALSLAHGYARGRVGTLPTLELEVNQLRGALRFKDELLELELGRFGAVVRGVGGADARGVGSLRLHEPGWVWTSFDGYLGDVQFGSVVRVEDDRVSATVTLPRAEPKAMRGLLPAYPLQRDALVRAHAVGRLPELALDAQVELGTTRANGRGTLKLAPRPVLDLDVDIDALDAAALVEGLPATELDASAHVLLQSAAGQPSVSVRAVSQPGTVDGIRVPAAEVDAVYEGTLLRGKALLREPGLPIHGEFALSPGGVFDFHAESPSVDLRRAPRLRAVPGSATGSVRVDAHIEAGRLRASASGTVRGYQHEDVTFGRATFEARARGRLNDWQHLNIEAQVRGDDLALAGLRFAHAAVRAEGVLARPRVNVDLEDARGGKLALSAFVAALRREKRVDDLSIGYKRDQAELSGKLARLRFDAGELEVQDFSLRGLGGELSGSLEWSAQRWTVDARGRELRIGDLARLVGLPSHYATGTLDFDADVLLARDIERGRLNARLTEGSLGPVPDVTAALNASLESGRLQGDVSVDVKNVATSNARYDIQVPGRVRELASWRDAIGELDADVSQINLGLLSQVLAPGKTPPIAGRLGLALRATRRVPFALPSFTLAGVTTGLAIQPRALHPSAPGLEGVDAQFGLNLSGESGSADASLRLVDARGPLASASVSTTLDLAELVKNPQATLARLPELPLLGKLLVDERQLSEFPRGLLPPFGDGKLRLEGTLTGSASSPVLAGRVKLGGFELADPASTRPLDLCATVAWDHSTRRLGSSGELFLSSAKARTCEGSRVALFSVLAGLPNASPQAHVEGSAVLSLERLPVDAIPGLGQSGLRGRVSGRASVTQSGPIPAFSANLTLHEARVFDLPVGDGKLEMRSNEQAVGVTLDLQQTQGSLQATLLAALDYSGLFPTLKAGEAIGLRVAARRADAVMLSPFVKDVLTDLTGTLDADVSARITRKEEDAASRAGRIEGSLALHGGSFELTGLGLKLQDVDFSAVAENDAGETRVSVPLLTGHSNQGRRAISVRDARLWLQGLTLARAEGNVDASELPLTLPGIPQATATTRQSIAFLVRRTEREMQANITVPYLVVALPQGAARDLISLDENRSIEILQPIAQPGKRTADGLPWRFAFELGQNVKLTRPDLELPLTGRVEVLLADETEVSGDVDLLAGGRIDVSGKTFVVEAGEVHFDTGDAGNPRIRVTAIYRPPDGSVITADVAGTLKQASLTLSSPTKDLQQIYATLLGGTSSGQGGDARAAGAGVGADQLLGPLLANTPLRKVEIRTGSELAADRRSYSTYSAAVPLSEQVWFEGSYKTLNSQDSREQGSALSGTIDFRFRRNWSLRTEVGTIGTGVDLLWNYRY